MEEIKEQNKIIYIAIGIILTLIYILIFSCLILFFTIENANADTINTNYNYIEAIKQNWGVGQSGYGNQLIDYVNYTFGYQWTPVYSNNQNISLQPSDYELYMNYEIVINELWPFLPTYQIQVYNGSTWVNATCDGNITDNMISQVYQNNWTRYNFEYKCDLLHVTSTFSAVRFRVYDTQILNPRSTIEFQINSSQFLDLKEISTGDQAIINNQNENTDKIINAYQNEMNATYTPQTPNGNDFNSLQQSENQLHTYTNVSLDSVGVSIDSDSASWVWNTLTSILNSHALIISMVISILSIGIMKLILNR